MIVIIFGILLLGFAVFASTSELTKKFSSYMKFGGIVLILLGLSTSCFKQINPGYVGVKVLFGKVQTDVLESGLHFINPLLDVKEMDVKTQNYTMSAIHEEGERVGDDAIKILTADGLEVSIDLTVLYKVLPSDAPKILNETGLDYNNKIIRPVTRTAIRDNAVYYEAVALYSTKRDEFQNRIFATIDKNFKSRGIILEQMLIRNVTLPGSVKASIESKINAEQDAQKMQFVLQKERQEAERKRVEAQGIADYQKIISSGLTDKQLQYETIKANLELAKSTNSKIIVLGKGNTPLIIDGK
ncbi:MAG: prohibitin family protein [bacterium]|nr:prohibitin family protein [bacterium]